jgi:hypothetical protein
MHGLISERGSRPVTEFNRTLKLGLLKNHTNGKNQPIGKKYNQSGKNQPQSGKKSTNREGMPEWPKTSYGG